MPKKILIVDDEPDMLDVADFRLRKAGYETKTVLDGQKALDMIKKDPPDLILLDLRLPSMSGADVCRTLKNDEKLKSIPVIIFTASAGMHIADKVKELRAEDYLTKPFDAEELLRKIKKLLEGI